jgi:hypothetical protein
MKIQIISWVMAWDGIVTKVNKHYLKEIEITTSIETYMQSIVLKKTLQCISFDYRNEEPDNEKEISGRNNSLAEVSKEEKEERS